MNEWTPAIVSMIGFGAFMLQGLVYYVGGKLGWIDLSRQVGTIGCLWALSSIALIVLGFLLSLRIEP